MGTIPQTPGVMIIGFTGIPVITQPHHKGCFFFGHGFKDRRIATIRFSGPVVLRLIEVSATTGKKRKIRSGLRHSHRSFVVNSPSAVAFLPLLLFTVDTWYS